MSQAITAASREPPHDFVDVTETAGDEVTQEQIERAARRYAWALPFCRDKHVLEIACGTGPGLGLLATQARRVFAGDISATMVEQVKRHYGNRVSVEKMDAQRLPFERKSLDVVIIFEALYYLPDPTTFAEECARVLRPGGVVLLSNANKDLFDFNPSPHSHLYHGVVELEKLFGSVGFRTVFWGDTPIGELSLRQRALRPIKKFVVALGLMPRSMAGKRMLKRLVFGKMDVFPAELSESMMPRLRLTALKPGVPDRAHKVILCAATKL